MCRTLELTERSLQLERMLLALRAVSDRKTYSKLPLNTPTFIKFCSMERDWINYVRIDTLHPPAVAESIFQSYILAPYASTSVWHRCAHATIPNFDFSSLKFYIES